jgi:adenine-specific DNA-methyltransferase
MIATGELRKSPKSGSIQYLIPASDFTLLDTDWTDIQEYDSEWNFPNGEKNIELLKRIIKMLDEPGAIILDSFAGSGTTAHAVLALNKDDDGNRKFILVECEDYADSITAERVRRVIKGVRGASDENLKIGLGGTFSYFELGKAIELESILDGKNLPGYLELARYVFYTATGEEFDERKVNEKRQFIGESKTHEVFLFYKPDIEHLKKTALTLERAEELGKLKDKRRLVFAPTKYLDQEQLDALRIDFAQLPFEIYKLAQ